MKRFSFPIISCPALHPTLLEKQSKFPRYNMKCRGKPFTTRTIPRSITFSPLHFILHISRKVDYLWYSDTMITVGRLIPWSWASPIAHRHRNYLVDYTCVPLRPICPRSRAATFAPLRHAASLHFHQFSRQPNVFFWDRANEYPGRVFATNLAQSWFWCEAKR